MKSFNNVVETVRGSKEWEEVLTAGLASTKGKPDFGATINVVKALFPSTWEEILNAYSVREIRDACSTRAAA